MNKALSQFEQNIARLRNSTEVYHDEVYSHTLVDFSLIFLVLLSSILNKKLKSSTHKGVHEHDIPLNILRQNDDIFF